MDQDNQKQTSGAQPTDEQEGKIISTTYAPLAPPYQVIKWSGEVGMQIGTFIVTVQKPGNINGLGYHIETHSHPVVAYENKQLFDKSHQGLFNSDPQLYSAQVMEGTVWDYVELKDVRTICLAGSTLSWDSYVEFLRREVMDAPPGKLPNAPLVLWLERLGVKVEPIGAYKPGSRKPDLTVWLDQVTTDRWGGRSMMCTRQGSPIVLRVDDRQGIRDMMIFLAGQLYKWGTLFLGRPDLGGELLKQPIRYATEVDNADYRFVVDELNRRYGTLGDIINSRGNYKWKENGGKIMAGSFYVEVDDSPTDSSKLPKDPTTDK